MNNVAKIYHHLLGGQINKCPKGTPERLDNFSKELDEKRNYAKFTTFKSEADDMIIYNGIKLFSFCEHHLLPYIGSVTIGYIPDKVILGASKFQRLVEKISSKPSIQEGLTKEIHDELQEILHPRGIGISVRAIHTCMFGRGINTSTITMSTQKFSGVMKDTNARSEFLGLVNHESFLR